MKFRYILRYYIDPGFHEDDRIAELAAFCQKSDIAEVMLFHNPEECYQGYSNETERSAWLALAKKIKSALNACGIAMSVNPWTTLVHRARGRSLPPHLKKMEMLVGETGEVSTITACPFSETWIDELSRWFARIARELAPAAIWVEDDWRLHNFGDEFGYGGCFCKEHLKRTAEKLGLAFLSREELLSRMAAGDLAARRAWINVCHDSLMEPGKKLEKAVHAANPDVPLALMRGLPDILSIEGADWREYKRIFSPDAPLLMRPHLPPYTEDFIMLCSPEVARQSVSEFETGEMEAYPEMESSPRSGRYSKSAAVVVWECLSAPLYGSRGITLNHFDMMGNGIITDPGLGEKLRQIKPRLDTLVGLGCSEENAQGVDVLYHPQVAMHMKRRPGGPFLGVMNNSISWGFTLSILGISHRLVRWEKFSAGRWNALSGETISALSDSEIETLLAAKLLLDANSIQLLCERGFGERIGVRRCEYRTLSQDGYAYEEVRESAPEVYGVDFPRLSAQRVCERVLKIDTDGEILTQIIRFDKHPLYPGMVLTKNQYLLSAWPMEEDQFYMGYFNRFRRILLQNALRARETCPAAFGGDFPYNVYLNRLEKGFLLSVGNPTHDEADSVDISLQNVPFERIKILREEGKWYEISCTRKGNGLHLDFPLKPLDFCFLHLL